MSRREVPEGSGRDFLVRPLSILTSIPMPGDKYLIYIRGNTLYEATEEALHLAYWLLTRALLEHRRQGRNGEYEDFAVGVLALLQRYRHIYTTQESESQEVG
jgi:hypothetical protein